MYEDVLIDAVQEAIHSQSKTFKQDLQEHYELMLRQEEHSMVVKAVAEERNLPEEVISSGIMYNPDEEYPFCQHLFNLEYNKPILVGRFCFPVKDIHGDLVSFVGWDKGGLPKYKELVTPIFNKSRTLLGMENLLEYLENDYPIFICEGVFDYMYLKSLGVNCLSLLGSSTSRTQRAILRPLESRLRFVFDNDQAGESGIKKLKYKFPKSFYYTPITRGSDIDDSRPTEGILSINAGNPFLHSGLFMR